MMTFPERRSLSARKAASRKTRHRVKEFPVIKSNIASMTRALVSGFFLFCLLATSFTTNAVDGTRHVPTIDELLTLKAIGGAQISPDGQWVAYTVTNADFKQDAFVTQIWLAETGSKGRTLQLTRGEKSSTNPRWSPDGDWLAFTSNRIEDKNQIFIINPAGG